MYRRRKTAISILLVIMILAGALLTTGCVKKDSAKIDSINQAYDGQVEIQFIVTAHTDEKDVILEYEDTEKRTVKMTSANIYHSAKSGKDTKYYYSVKVKIDMPEEKDSLDIKFTVSFMGVKNENGKDVETRISDSKTFTFKSINPFAAIPTQAPADTLVPGNNGIVTIDALTESSAQLSWAPAEHSSLSHDELNYTYVLTNQTTQAVISESILGATSIALSSLDDDTTYELTLEVSGNDLSTDYQTITFTTQTAVDTDPPIPGNSGSINYSNRGSSSFAVSWSDAQDNETPSAELSYCVYYSTQDNISSLSQVLSNGTPYGSYTVNMLQKAIYGLNENTYYYVNVVVEDMEGNKSAYNTVKVKTKKQPLLIEPTPAPDDAPLPGAGVTANNPTEASVDVSWNRATDKETDQGNLSYLVYYSESDNIDTLANTLKNGTVFGTYAKDITSQVVTGLNANTTYYFNVVVKDSKGNRAAYTSASQATTPLTEIVHDITPPTPGGGATVTTSNPTTTTIDVYWTKGSDDTSAQANLEYLVYYSKLDNINTVEQMESNGTAAGSYSADISSKTVTELTAATGYYFNVIIRDEAGNKSAYTKNSASTLSAGDVTAPTPGGGGTITTSNPTTTTIDVSWTKGSDDTSAQANLEYLVYYSESDNISTVAQMESNGTAAGSYSADISTKTVTGLTAGRGYYFNVIIRDEAGNKSAYTVKYENTISPA